VLDRSHRITSSGDFVAAVRRGRRAGSSALVVHLLRRPSGEQEVARVGFVVGKGVGNAVTRNQVKRRLRHLVRERLDALPGGALLVVRALPGAADRSSSSLADELDRALVKALSPGGRR
jgi:ribonuclease P protein component